MYLNAKEKDLLYQIFNFYDKDYNEIKNKFFLIKSEEEYNKTYSRIFDKMRTLEEEIKSEKGR